MSVSFPAVVQPTYYVAAQPAPQPVVAQTVAQEPIKPASRFPEQQSAVYSAPVPPAPQAVYATASNKVSEPSGVQVTGATEIIEMDRMRKLIAEHMVMSKHVSPHVTSFVEVDVTNILWGLVSRAAFKIFKVPVTLVST